GTSYGLLELQGLVDTRLFDPTTDSWSVTNPMHWGRWYPSLVTLGNGSVFVASGVTKLIKPIYTNPKTAVMSGRNVVQTEIFNPLTATWTENRSSANRSLPLYPRIHLLPDGHVFYDAGGEVFNPFGEAYDEALWNATASYDPATQKWTTLGVPLALSLDLSRGAAGVGPTAGFRGSTFSVMLPLQAPYNSASFLSAGGTLGTTPGSYFATTSSSIDTVTIKKGKESFSSRATGPLVNARWFSTAVPLPTGQVVAFNGDNRDDVVGPGTTFPVAQAELFDPATGKWSPLASTIDPRGYHNTAILLPTGQVLVGGGAPISALDMYNQTLPGGFADNWRDPSFQLYDPPYLHWGYTQPAITSVSAGSALTPVDYGTSFALGVAKGSSGGAIAKVVLVRNPADTHVVDGDQRSVELPFVVNGDGSLTVNAPPNGNVAPPGDYMLFVDQVTPKGLVPSVAASVWVGGSPDQVPPGLSRPR
ncbi:MAG: galactose oxidase-like domain-containing protein, partial [Acidimicrobiales bacterium]